MSPRNRGPARADGEVSRWATVAPIIPDWRGPTFDLTGPIDIGWGVQLITLPGWLKQERITSYMSWVEREQYVGAAKFAFFIEYDADSLGEPDPLSDIGFVSKQHLAAEKISRANLALWLARPSWAGFPIV